MELNLQSKQNHLTKERQTNTLLLFQLLSTASNKSNSYKVLWFHNYHLQTWLLLNLKPILQPLYNTRFQECNYSIQMLQLINYNNEFLLKTKLHSFSLNFKALRTIKWCKVRQQFRIMVRQNNHNKDYHLRLNLLPNERARNSSVNCINTLS